MKLQRAIPLLVLFLLAAVLVPVLLARPARSGASTTFVRVPASETAALAELDLAPDLVVDYGSFRWLGLDEGDLASLANSDVAFRQEPDAGQIQISRFRFDPLIDGEPALPDPLKTAGSGPRLSLVQLLGPTKDGWLDQLASTGLTVLQYYPNYAYLVWGPDGAAESAANLEFVRWQGPVHPGYKIDAELQGLAGRIENVDIVIYNDDDVAETLEAIAELGADLVQAFPSQPDKAFYDGLFQMDASLIDDVARLETVLWLGYLSPEPILDDEMSDQILAGNHPGGVPVTGYNAHLANLGVDGTGVTWAIIDTGVDYDHPDLNTHIVGGYSFPGACNTNPGEDCSGGGHGTHVAGIVGGTGVGDVGGPYTDPNGFLYGLGVAPGYGIFAMNSLSASAWPPAGGWQEHSKRAVLGGAIGGNNSWTTGEGTQHGYQSSERTHDIMVLDGNFDTTTVAEPFIEVFSAGNSGTSGLTAPKEAKNLIVTASSRNYRAGNIDDISSFSSRGPAVDGRWVPTIATPGESIASSRNDLGGSCSTAIAGTNNLYAFCSGTSMAAPHTSGAIALITEWWRGFNLGADPSPAMAKALLVNGAVDMGTADIPNANEGWGRVNVTNIISATTQVKYYDQPQVLGNSGEQWILTVGVPDPTQPLKVTLVWADAPGAVGANPALVNDLNLTVVNGGNTYLGNVFSGGWSATGGSADSINNLENVYVQSPGANATITIDAANIAGDAILYNADPTDQSFALVCSNCALFPDFTLAATPTSQAICTPDNAVYDVNVGSILGYSDPITFSASGHPAGTTAVFSDTVVIPPSTNVMTITNTGAATAGSYNIDIVGVAPTSTHTTTVGLDIYTSAPGSFGLTAPPDGATNVSFRPAFAWTAASQGVTYTLEVASDPAMTNLVYNATVLGTSHQMPVSLMAATTYYWRVTPENACGVGSASPVFSFTTQTSSLICNGATVDFDSGIPGDWTVANNAPGNPVTWTNVAGCGEAGNYATGNGDAACASSDLQGGGSGLYDTELWSPPMDLRGFGQVTLDYWANYGNFALVDFLDLDVSTDGGATWTTLLSWNEDHHPNGLRNSPGEQVTLDLSAYTGQSNVTLRWHYYDPDGPATSQDWYAQLDEVSLTCPVGPHLALEKTVGLDPNVCATGDSIVVGGPTDVTYCYAVRNTGTVTETLHDLDDSELGTIRSSLAYTLAPGASVWLTQTASIAQTTVNTATWMAYNTGPTDVVSDTDTATVQVLSAAPFPTCVDFESGGLPNFMYPDVINSPPASGRVAVTTSNPHAGNYAVEIDTDCGGACGTNTYTQQAAVMLVDLAGETNVLLDFWVYEFADESNPEDGVFISDDGGTTWAQILSLNGFPNSYQNVVIDLAAAASGAGISLVDGFQIKFQSYDNFNIPTDGYAFDDICVQPDVASISLDKTVGLDPNVCAITDSIDVPAGTEVTYCYEVTNTGNFSVKLHDLDDSELGTILSGFGSTLTPGASLSLTQTATITQTTVNTGTWTAYNAGPTDVAVASDSATVNVVSAALIDVEPASLVQSQAADVQVTVPLTIANLGDVGLDWTIIEEASLVSGEENLNQMTGGDAALAREHFNSADGGKDLEAELEGGPVRLWQPSGMVLYDNGPLVNSSGTGAGGADESMLQSSSLGMSALGFGHQASAGNRITDDFTISNPGGWQIDRITFFAYETGAPTSGTMTAVTLRIWDGPPNGGGSVIWGDTTTNVMVSSGWSNIYRVSETTSGNTARAVMANVVDLGGLVLPPGTYWLDWSAGGSATYTGPWAPPVTINGQATTGNALQWTGSWIPANDGGTGTQQGFPFVIEGAADPCTPSDIPWLSTTPKSGTVSAMGSQVVDVTFDSTGLVAGVYTGTLCINSNDFFSQVTRVPLTLTVQLPSPTANFSAMPLSGIAPLNVAFTNLSTGAFSACSWDFGDGGTSSDCGNPNHTYNSGGVFNVALTVSGPGGSDTETKTSYITVKYTARLPIIFRKSS